MSAKVGQAAFDLPLVADGRPAPPSGPSERIEPVILDIRPTSSVAPVIIPPDAILDLGAAAIVAPRAAAFGALRARAGGVLGRARALAGAAQVGRLRRPWRGLRARATATVAPTTSVAAVPGETLAAPPRPAKHKLSWREQRWERRRRRRIGEEILGWILVPVIVGSVAWGVTAGLAAFGTSPSALYQNVKAAMSGRGGGG